ncbi:MAG: cell envelope integrity EipB family protein [Candidatus Puniceispirillum sp.]|jgi:hypothetical protein|nr:cell envelope integrity EipB family protein [Candidatus Puniceispirillum sp.]
MKSQYISIGYVACVSGVMFFTSAQPVMAGAVVAHRAFYEMTIGEMDKNSSVLSVSGRSAYSLERDCDGWRSVEDYVIEFGSAGGNVQRILSHFESWEADSGDKYSFDIDEKSTFDGSKQYSGFAQMTANGGNAFFNTELDETVNLPDDTYFPMQHVEEIIESAHSGTRMIAASLFTGAEPEDALMTTNTVIGGWRISEAPKAFGDFAKEGFWPVHVAYFKPLATESEPSYEINFSLQPNGVVRDYEIDYGEFSIKANLLNVEKVGLPVCN